MISSLPMVREKLNQTKQSEMQILLKETKRGKGSCIQGMCESKDNKIIYYRQERFSLPDKTLVLSVNPTEILALFDTD